VKVRSRKLASIIALVFGAQPLGGIAPSVTGSIVAAAEVELPGFQLHELWDGFNLPTALAFASDGRVFVAERDGHIWTFDSIGDTTRTLVADLSRNVHAQGDRGLLGLAAHPEFAAHPYLYAAYMLDAPPGESPPFYNDNCPNFPEGCPATGRLARLQIGPDGQAVGAEQVLIGNESVPYWCHQQRGHALDHVAFGPDGALYISSGEGASGSQPGGDWGQHSGSSNARTPPNTCGDPPVPIGQQLTLPTTEGGALRAQDLLTSGDPAGGNGAIVRVHPETGAALSDNPLVGNGIPSDDRHIAFGLRNPYRFTFRPGTDEIWVADVGWNTWEEVNRIPDPTDSTVENFGWPCYEGGSTGSAINGVWDGLNANLCEELYAGEHGPVTAPYWSFRHNHSPDSANCSNAGSALSGIAFSQGDPFPAFYDGALFVADYVKACIWVLPAGANGLPSPTLLETIASGVAPLDLEIGPDGSLYFVDLLEGSVNRITYFSDNEPPLARIAADPPYGPTPLTVQFDASQSTDDGGTAGLSYAWDLDGDGAYDDATGITASRTYSDGSRNVDVGLRVTDTSGGVGTTSIEIQPGNTPPDATIVTPTPTTTWAVGDQIAFSGTVTDAEQPGLGASSMLWTLILHHCVTQTDCHQHPQGDKVGVASGSFLAPEHGYPAFLEIRLLVTDARGLHDTESVRLDPRTVRLTFRTEPVGLELLVGFERGPTPVTVTAIVGSSISVSAPSPQSVGSETYAFSRWSDGGAITHDVVAGSRNATHTALFGGEGNPVSPPFTDIGGHLFEADIAWAFANGITVGCGATRFCPDAPVAREQMASFLVRALDLPPAGADHFSDDTSSIHQGDINALFEAGITVGCGGTHFCPGSVVRRGQMTAFLHRALP